MGHGFVEGNTGVDAAHDAFLSVNLGCTLRDPSYFALSGATARFPDLIPKTVVNATGRIYCVENSCLFTNDVLDVNSGVPGAQVASEYQNLGGAGPYTSGVYVPSGAAHPYVTLTDGWDMVNLFSRRGLNDTGRLYYFMDALTNVFGSVCPFTGCPSPCMDVPQSTARNVDFMGNVWGNPMVAGGQATVHFGLAKTDRVQVKVYDVTGRLVRTLADRTFSEGPQTLIWDGTNDQGQGVSRGVYFTRVKFVQGGFEAARKLTILR
jgi:hypothetical protein